MPASLMENSSSTEAAAPGAPASPNGSAARKILAASSVLGVATGLERGLGFAANLLAARIGGAGVFGAYSLALTTANNLASYAGGGIGSTATRFSGQHGDGSSGYRTLVRTLALVSSISALLATVALAGGAGFLARWLLRNPELTDLLRWAALSAGAMVLMECCRGFLVGQRAFRWLLLFSAVAGSGLLIGLPIAAHFSPKLMVIVQASVFLLAVGVVAVKAFRKSAASAPATSPDSLGPMVKQVWSFGMVQLAGIVGLNAAGWWVASLVARSDTSLVQMGLFAASNQLRNMAALTPGLLAQSSYGMLAEQGENAVKPHEQVLVLCSLGANAAGTAIAGAVILILPWALPLLYGATFQSGILTASLALATAVVHMGATAATARLTIVSLRDSGFINALWTVVVVVLATHYVLAGGAVAAAGLYLVTHLLSASLVLLALRRWERLPAGLVAVNLLGMGTACLLAILAIWRDLHPEALYSVSLGMCALIAGSLLAVGQLARVRGWVPRSIDVHSLRAALSSLPRRNGGLR